MTSSREAHLLETCILKMVPGTFREPPIPKSTCAGGAPGSHVQGYWASKNTAKESDVGDH